MRSPALVLAVLGLCTLISEARGEELEGVSGEATALAGDSVSCGSVNRGALSGAVELPQQGLGFEVPDPWWSRGYRYGTEELVGLVTRAAATVELQHPGAVLGVGDLSREHGGALPGHRSHQSGRDVDLIYYALDPAGRPFRPDEHMAYYTRTGRARYAKAPEWARHIPERYFDLARNWALVKVLVSDAEVEIEHIFVSRRIRRWLLDYARRIGEPEALVARAARVLRRPSSAGGHNDHMHVRVACSADDVARGRCRDGIVRRRGRRKFYARVRCPRRPRVAMPEGGWGMPVAELAAHRQSWSVISTASRLVTPF